MKISVLLILSVSMFVGCSEDSTDPLPNTSESLTARVLCDTIADREGERVRVSGSFARGDVACTARACSDASEACNYCDGAYYLDCNESEDDDEDAGITLHAADDLDLPFVGYDPEGPEFLYGEIRLKTKLGCVGSEDELFCSPEDPADIVSVVGTVTEFGGLRVHEVELRAE